MQKTLPTTQFFSRGVLTALGEADGSLWGRWVLSCIPSRDMARHSRCSSNAGLRAENKNEENKNEENKNEENKNEESKNEARAFEQDQ
jgi:hypothetical protein